MANIVATLIVLAAGYYTLTFALFNLRQGKIHAAIGVAVLASLTVVLSIYSLYFKGF